MHRPAKINPYGTEISDYSNLDRLPTGGVGLLFMCYQSDIWEQFEFIQRFWSNNPTFLEPAMSIGSGKFTRLIEM
ncbi:Dyp-type peroxidase [Nostoc edaphicum CCNP1411]|uniref:Dyp-type peroxidase n=1 Tax=Nostoc edaphicum CCNP1411 TaxID=1472755 RepID=A0A7D7LJ99_9NOSO|nr:Dyp-type peroxidase [Nostoc edaphicum CCNP1411]